MGELYCLKASGATLDRCKVLMLDKWLGRWFLLQTFDNDTDCDVAEIRRILDVSDGDDNE